VVLGVGEQRLLQAEGITRFSLGGDSVRAIRPPQNSPSALLIKATKPGTTDLWIWKHDGSSEKRTVLVQKTDPLPLKPSLLRALSLLDEIEIIYSGESAVLRGEIRRLREATRVASLVREFQGQVIDETSLDPELLETGRAKIEAWLRSTSTGKTLRTETNGGSLWVRGSVEQSTEKSWLEKKLRALFPLVLLDLEALPDSSPTVYFRVFLLELKRSRFSTIGISWPALQEAGFRVTTAGIQDLLALDQTLQQLEGDGAARILSNPEIAVRAPGEAELFAGGEIPVRVQSQYFSNVNWKTYGLSLKLKVTHSAGDRIRLDIFTEVSHLDTTIGSDKIPGVQANRMKTQVDAKYGQPLLLSGLLQQGLREQARGLPFLRTIPVLGLLFGSEDYLNERSELIAILHPHASPPAAPIQKVKSLIPSGPMPLPRDWITPSEEASLRKSPDYPWNALQ